MTPDRLPLALLILKWVLGLVLGGVGAFRALAGSRSRIRQNRTARVCSLSLGMDGDRCGPSVPRAAQHGGWRMVSNYRPRISHRHPSAARLVRRRRAARLCGGDVGGSGGKVSAAGAKNMNGLELIGQFEGGATPADTFHHADHVRLAFEYLCRYTCFEALEKFSAALQRFAAAQGKTQLYHETITWAYLLLIRERIARAGCVQTWEQFAEHNADLLVWKGGLLERFYRKETLASDLARTTFIFPDQVNRG
jgi:hypothetical protein